MSLTYLGPSPTLPTIWVAEGFALPVATALSSLRFTAPLLAAEHFRLLALRCGTACHRRLRRRHLWQPSALDLRRFCSLSHILTFGSSDTFVSTRCTLYSGTSSVKYLGHSKSHDWLNDWLTDNLVTDEREVRCWPFAGCGRPRCWRKAQWQLLPEMRMRRSRPAHCQQQ